MKGLGHLGTSWNDAIAFILNIFIPVLEIQINFHEIPNFGSFGLVRVSLSFGHNRTRTDIFGDCFELGFPRLIEVMK